MTQILTGAAHDLMPIFVTLKVGDLSITLSAPGPLPDPYVGDDLRTAEITIETGQWVKGSSAKIEIAVELREAQLSELSMGIRKALLHMQGRN